MSSERTILITNDDGIRSDGIEALKNSLEGLGQVIMVAPDQEQSASSHAITLDKPLRITEYSNSVFGVSGTPTDCVILAVHGILKRKPDLLLSGINHGPNMGEDVNYSGTVAAALEGFILGIPSIAVSIASWENVPLDAAAKASRYLAGKMSDLDASINRIWNINVPPLPADEIKGIKITKLGSRVYNDLIIKKTDPRGKDYFWIGGGEPGWSYEENTDFAAVTDGYISVSPLSVDLTDYKDIFELKKLEFEW